MIIKTMVVTAYCLLGGMANGQQVHQHSIACPRSWALGTKVEIQGKMYTCHDRMGPKYKEGRIDVWMPKCSNAIIWGKKTLKVKIYDH